MASVHCNSAIFRLLVLRVQRVIHQVDNREETALIRIVRSGSSSKGRYESARILLSYVEAHRTALIVNGKQEALQLAEQLGDVEMCRLLTC